MSFETGLSSIRMSRSGCNGLLTTWALHNCRSDVADAIAAHCGIEVPALRRRLMAWSLGSQMLVPGLVDVDDFLSLIEADAARAASLIRDGSLQAWLEVIGHPVKVDPLPLSSDDHLLRTWSDALGSPRLIVGSRRVTSAAPLVEALSREDPEATLLFLYLIYHLKNGWLNAILPAAPGDTGVPGNLVLLRLWRAGLRSFFHPDCGWKSTPKDLADWADTEQGQRRVPWLSGIAIRWIELTAPQSQIPSCFLGNAGVASSPPTPPSASKPIAAQPGPAPVKDRPRGNLGFMLYSPTTHESIHHTMLDAGRTIPASASRRFTTTEASTQRIVLKIMEYDSSDPSLAVSHGQCVLDDLPRVSRGTPFDVIFDLQWGGNLKVSIACGLHRGHTDLQIRWVD